MPDGESSRGTKRPRRAKPAGKPGKQPSKAESTGLAEEGASDGQPALVGSIPHRCTWMSKYTGTTDPEYIAYHDDEWGRPVKDDNVLFELLVLEGAQAGLSWYTILKRREGYRRAFSGFDPSVVAGYGEDRVQALLVDEGIIRHQGKIRSAINNAQCVLRVQQELGSFAKLIWSFVPGGRPLVNNCKQLTDVPAKTDASEAMSKELKRRGFTFVGPTTCYSLMQAAGLVNDHEVSCFCHAPLVQLAEDWVPPE